MLPDGMLIRITCFHSVLSLYHGHHRSYSNKLLVAELPVPVCLSLSSHDQRRPSILRISRKRKRVPFSCHESNKSPVRSLPCIYFYICIFSRAPFALCSFTSHHIHTSRQKRASPVRHSTAIAPHGIEGHWCRCSQIKEGLTWRKKHQWTVPQDIFG